MPNLTLTQKASRVTTFLTALTVPEIGAALQRVGFTESERVRGYTLLAGLTEGCLQPRPTPVPSDPRIIEGLERWEREYLPMLNATLRQRYPEFHYRILGNLGAARGAEVVPTIRELVRRLDALMVEDDAISSEVVSLLAHRGLTEEALEKARVLLAGAVEEPPRASSVARAQRLADAERELSDWYREWTAIAIEAIEDDRLLRRLGLLRDRRESDIVPARHDVDSELAAAVEALLRSEEETIDPMLSEERALYGDEPESDSDEDAA